LTADRAPNFDHFTSSLAMPVAIGSCRREPRVLHAKHEALNLAGSIKDRTAPFILYRRFAPVASSQAPSRSHSMTSACIASKRASLWRNGRGNGALGETRRQAGRRVAQVIDSKRTGIGSAVVVLPG
jgi:hypothetical protein